MLLGTWEEESPLPFNDYPLLRGGEKKKTYQYFDKLNSDTKDPFLWNSDGGLWKVSFLK